MRYVIIVSILIFSASCDFFGSKKETEKTFFDPAVLDVTFLNGDRTKRTINRNLFIQTTRYGSPRIYNSTKTEYLEVIPSKKSDTYKFSTFRVKSVSPEDAKSMDLPVSNNVTNFVSQKGVKLGITPAQLKELLGKDGPQKIKSKDNMMIIRYAFKKSESDILQKIDMDNYIADYIFKAGKLVQFRWGFGKAMK